MRNLNFLSILKGVVLYFALPIMLLYIIIFTEFIGSTLFWIIIVVAILLVIFTTSRRKKIGANKTSGIKSPAWLSWDNGYIAGGVMVIVLLFVGLFGWTKYDDWRTEKKEKLIRKRNEPAPSIAVPVSYTPNAPAKASWPSDMPYQELVLGRQTLKPGISYRYERDTTTKFYFNAVHLPATAKVTIHKLGNGQVYVIQQFRDDGSAQTIENRNDGSDGWKYVTVDEEVEVNVSGVINTK